MEGRKTLLTIETLNAFLKSCKQRVGEYGTKRPNLKFVMGNCTADMDSVVGSTLLAYQLSLQYQKSYIPVINTSREELPARIEINHLLETCKVSSEDLIFWPEVYPTIKEISDTSDEPFIVLFDHCILETEKEYLSPFVELIVDHHVTSEKTPQNCEKQIELIGSATTFVAERFLNMTDFQINEKLSTLMGSPILIDCINFPESLKGTRWKEKDLAIYNSLATQSDPKLDDEYFDILNAIKFDEEKNIALGLQQNLRKDYKKFLVNGKMIGYSAILAPIEKVIRAAEPEFEDTLKGYYETQDLSALLLLSNFWDSDKKQCREILVYSPEEALNETIFAALDKGGCEMKKKSLSNPSSNMLFSQQGNVKFSRKQVEPLVRKVFEEI
mmetsp:Transcript_50636/g.58053  ORF Transcript_50636/g.58053 Transcript_50636/m.58053 type:complete len:385 (+) Transcript_50636:50-1204(+)